MRPNRGLGPPSTPTFAAVAVPPASLPNRGFFIRFRSPDHAIPRGLGLLQRRDQTLACLGTLAKARLFGIGTEQKILPFQEITAPFSTTKYQTNFLMGL